MRRRTTANSVYVAIAGEVVNRRSVLLRHFVLNGQESASNPLLHIHANRWFINAKWMVYEQFYKKRVTHQKHPF